MKPLNNINGLLIEVVLFYDISIKFAQKAHVLSSKPSVY